MSQLFSPLVSFFRFLGRLIIAAAWVFVVTLVAWSLLRWYPGERWLLVRLGNYFAPWLWMALAPALIVAWLARRPWLARAILVLGLILGMRYWPLLAPRLSLIRAEADAGQLRVMTFNVKYANRNAPAIAGLVRAEAPDIVAMQELTRELALQLQAELGAEYPYFLFDGSNGLTGLLSRYPLQVQPVPPSVLHTQRASVETPGGAVSVWSVHLATALTQYGWERQKEMATAMAEEIEREPGPLIVLGDLNTTDNTQSYRLVTERLTDAHRAVGSGFGFTFPELRHPAHGPLILGPVVRIDHILVSEHFLPQEIHVAPSAYDSDHRPVVATLGFGKR